MPSKGQMDAVLGSFELLKKKYNIELAIVGPVANQSYYQEIKNFIEKNNLKKRIHLIDFVLNPYPVIKKANIVLSCSKNEAFGRITVEAMLLKKAVIGTKSGGTPELIKDGETGILYQPGNFKELAEKIEHLIKNKQKIKILGENAYQFIKKNITKKNYGVKIYKILTMVKKQKPVFGKLNLFTDALINAFVKKLLEKETTNLNQQQLNNLTQENQNLKTQIQQMQTHIQNLETQLNTIKSAKFFKLWQGYCRIMKALGLKKD